MRRLKISLIAGVLAIIILVVGHQSYQHFYRMPRVYREWKNESIAALQVARSPRDLTNAVGPLGLCITLTNGDWIAIRYQDTHNLPIISCAIARDSDGLWFESDRHFCGSLRAWPRHKQEVADDEEDRRLYPDLHTNRLSRLESFGRLFPSFQEMMAIESAPNIDQARVALAKIGFVPLVR